MIRHVMTQKFLNGHAGRDHEMFDFDGIRRDKSPGNPPDWTMAISTTKSGRLQVKSHTVWTPTGDVSSVSFNSDGDMLFKKDYGGDSTWIYRCRAPGPASLVCVLKDHESGHGLEFRKAPASPNKQPAPAPAH